MTRSWILRVEATLKYVPAFKEVLQYLHFIDTDATDHVYTAKFVCTHCGDSTAWAHDFIREHLSSDGTFVLSVSGVSEWLAPTLELTSSPAANELQLHSLHRAMCS